MNIKHIATLLLCMFISCTLQPCKPCILVNRSSKSIKIKLWINESWFIRPIILPPNYKIDARKNKHFHKYFCFGSNKNTLNVNNKPFSLNKQDITDLEALECHYILVEILDDDYYALMASKKLRKDEKDELKKILNLKLSI